MIIVLSPAKTLDFATPARTASFTQPRFLRDSARLIKLLRPLGPDGVAGLLGISQDLAALNAGRYQGWHTPFTPGNAKQAALAFDGDVYGGLDAPGLAEADLAFAQDQVRILSGLYGLLRPLDLIQPYRLEMGTQLANARGKDLYAFWRADLTKALKEDLAQGGGAPVLVNLASQEYFKALEPRGLEARIITPVFEDWKNGTYKVISFYAKRARGLLARHAILKRLGQPEPLKRFKAEGYAFDARASEGDRWVFRRKALS
jgi:cytoplasmic iron level regulating protein YaaA (DUF328/UPF0246 family)